MASVYVHKNRGFQVRFVLYFPDGTESKKFRYRATRGEADELCRDCAFLERGSRSGSLTVREIVQARHDGLVSEDEACLLSGGRAAVVYDLNRVRDAYISVISVSHTPVALEKALGKVALLIEWLRSHPIPDLREADIRGYILDRRSGKLSFRNAKTGYARAGVKPKTVRNELEFLAGIIGEAIKLGMVTDNVVRSVSFPVKTSTIRRSMNAREVKALIASAVANRRMLHGQAYELIMVALYTGYRRSELRTLTWDEDVRMDSRQTVVQSKSLPGDPDFDAKGGKARIKAMPDALFDVFAGMERRGRFVFGGKNPYNIDSISHTIKVIFERAGLGALSLHFCRHTYTSWMLRETGGDLKLVQEDVGHKSLTTTQKYAHLVDDDTDPRKGFSYD